MGDTAIVYIHGIMGSPVQFLPLRQAVRSLDVDSYALQLPGHGQSGREFIRSTHVQWQDYAHEEIARVRKARRLILVGHSMGGLLCLSYAAAHGADGIVLINTPARMHVTRRMITMGARSMFSSPARDDEYMRACRANRGVSGVKLHQYLFFLKPMGGLRPLIRQAMAGLHQIHAPTMIFQSRLDETVRVCSARDISAGMTHAPVQLNYLEHSYHFYFPDEDERRLACAFRDFVQGIAHHQEES